MNRLRELRKRKGLTQSDLAEKLGVTSMSISRYENGKDEINNKNLKKLSEIFDVSIDYLLGNTEEEHSSDWQEISIKPVPVFSEGSFTAPLVASLRCGYNHSGTRVYDVLQEIELPSSFKTKYGDDIVLIKAIGESMMPTIRPRDLLICKPGNAWKDGSVVVINIDDSDTIKRIQRTKDGGIDLIPDNPEYRTTHFTKTELADYPLHVLGRIVRNMGQDL